MESAFYSSPVSPVFNFFASAIDAFILAIDALVGYWVRPPASLVP
jgi:hypothetical protein